MATSKTHIPRLTPPTLKSGPGPGLSAGTSRCSGSQGPSVNPKPLSGSRPTASHSSSLPKFMPIRKLSLADVKAPVPAANFFEGEAKCTSLGATEEAERMDASSSEDGAFRPGTGFTRADADTASVSGSTGEVHEEAACAPPAPSSPKTGADTNPAAVAKASGAAAEVMDGVVPAPADKTTSTCVTQYVALGAHDPYSQVLSAKSELLKRQLEDLLSKPKAVQALATALSNVDNCKISTNTSASASPQRTNTPSLGTVLGAWALIMILALSLSMAWIVWVLVDRQIIGHPEIPSIQFEL